MKITVFCWIVLAAVFAQAQSSESVLKAELSQKKFQDDHTLTDSKLRADDGSLSRWSLKGSMTYMGPSFGDWSAPDQPNPDGSVGNYSQRIIGSMSARRRLSPTETISMGTGMSFNHPFHGMDRTDVNNPFISYDFASRRGNLQMRNSPGIMIATVPNYTVTGEVGGLNWTNSMVYNLGTSRLALSLDNAFYWWVFKRGYRPGPTKQGGDGLAEEFSLGFYPGVKYVFSDAVNVYTSYGIKLYNPRSLTDKGALWNHPGTWQVGLSYAYDRNIYIAPNIQTYPGIMTAEATTFNIATSFSLL